MDFSAVRVHADAPASDLAAAFDARAFTLGRHIVVNRGEYAPQSAPGRELIAHELAHVAQQSVTPEAADTVRRLSYAEIKEKAYSGLTGGLRSAQDATLNKLRKLAAEKLPASWYPAADTLIDIVDVVIGAVFAVLLAVIGIVVGFGEGIFGMVRGLVDLGYGVIKLLYDLISGIFTNFDAAKSDLNAVVAALKALPGALKKLVTDWLDQFKKASSERQSLMIGELTGQVLALIATYALAAGRAGTAARAATEAGEIGGAAGAVGEAADVAGTAAKARPALTVIQGGGGGGGAVARAGATTEGSAALSLAEADPAVQPAVRLVPPPVEAPAEAAQKVAGAGASTARKVAAVGVTAAGAATEASRKRAPDPFAMRFQVQWNTNGGGPTFALPAVAPASPGVTTGQAIGVLNQVVDSVTPKSAREAAEPAAEAQRRWILARPPGGVDIARSWSKYFVYGRYTDARVDVENLRGHNLRV
jgi:hypothetical protein